MQHFHLNTKHSQVVLGPFQFPLKYENDGINGSFTVLCRYPIMIYFYIIYEICILARSTIKTYLYISNVCRL